MHPDHLKDLAPAQPAPDVFAVHQHVWDAVTTLPHTRHTDSGDTHRVCHLCRQSMYLTQRGGIDYQYAVGEEQGLVFAHMAQAHGWTRETVGDV